MKRFTSVTQQRGELGEKIAVKYLKDRLFNVVETNYTKKIGEIDIVAFKDMRLHFIEVKTIIEKSNDFSAFKKDQNDKSSENDQNVSRETYSPFQNVSRVKFRKFARTCEWYLVERNVSRDTPWQIDVIAVIVSRETRSAKIEVLWNVII